MPNNCSCYKGPDHMLGVDVVEAPDGVLKRRVALDPFDVLSFEYIPTHRPKRADRETEIVYRLERRAAEPLLIVWATNVSATMKGFSDELMNARYGYWQKCGGA